MSSTESILNELREGKDNDFMIGLLIQENSISRFVIAKIKEIATDLKDLAQSVILLSKNDINGEPLSCNRILLRNIKAVRVYKQLRGCEEVMH